MTNPPKWQRENVLVLSAGRNRPQVSYDFGCRSAEVVTASWKKSFCCFRDVPKNITLEGRNLSRAIASKVVEGRSIHDFALRAFQIVLRPKGGVYAG